MDSVPPSAKDCINCGQPIEPRWSQLVREFVWPWICPHCKKHTSYED